MNLVLAILYAPEGQKPLSIARIRDRGMLSAAAERAIAETESHASSLLSDDPVLASLQFEEANRLRRVLRALLPTVRRPDAIVM